jgi:hypothetical protein
VSTTSTCVGYCSTGEYGLLLPLCVYPFPDHILYKFVYLLLSLSTNEICLLRITLHVSHYTIRPAPHLLDLVWHNAALTAAAKIVIVGKWTRWLLDTTEDKCWARNKASLSPFLWNPWATSLWNLLQPFCRYTASRLDLRSPPSAACYHVKEFCYHRFDRKWSGIVWSTSRIATRTRTIANPLLGVSTTAVSSK